MEAKQQLLLKQVAANKLQHTKAVNVFKETYEGLNIGSYTDEVLTDVISSGITNVSSRFKAIAGDQLDKSGVTSPLLKANLLKGCDEVLSMFNDSIQGLAKSAEAFNKKAAFDVITSRQMHVAFMGIGGYYISFQNENVKRLEVGIGGGFTTKCGKSHDLGHSKIEIRPTNDTWHLYVKLLREGGKGVLCAFIEPQDNNNEYFFIHWQSGTFNEIKIPA